MGSFAFNYPALILVCSVIHGFSLAVVFMGNVNVVFLGVPRRLFRTCQRQFKSVILQLSE